MANTVGFDRVMGCLSEPPGASFLDLSSVSVLSLPPSTISPLAGTSGPAGGGARQEPVGRRFSATSRGGIAGSPEWLGVRCKLDNIEDRWRDLSSTVRVRQSPQRARVNRAASRLGHSASIPHASKYRDTYRFNVSLAGATRSRAPPALHAGVAITVPRSGALLTGFATALGPGSRRYASALC